MLTVCVLGACIRVEQTVGREEYTVYSHSPSPCYFAFILSFFLSLGCFLRHDPYTSGKVLGVVV